MSNPELLIYSWNSQASFFDEQSSHILTDIDSRITAEVKLIVVALQEAVKPGSQFMSLILPNHLATKGFSCHCRSRLMGVGVTTYKALQRFDLRLRGLRLALFVHESWLDDCPPVVESYCYCSGMYQYSLGKGGLAFSLQLPNGLGTLKLVNLHLPFSASSLNSQEDSVRQASIEWQTDALKDIWNQLVDLEKDDYVFLVGDYNYRVRLWSGETVNSIDYSDPLKVYLERDELLTELSRENSRLPHLQEGIENRGPQFPPTAKLIQKGGGTFNHGKYNRRAPSWCDRILYNQSESITCLNYERLEPNAATENSDHAAITARFALSKEENSDP